MTRDEAIHKVLDFSNDPNFGSHTGEAAQAADLLHMVPDAAFADLGWSGVRPASDLPGDGSVVLEWNRRVAGAGRRLLRFESHGYSGFYVTLDQFAANGPKPDLSSFPWSFGADRPGELFLGDRGRHPLIDALFAWYLAD
jgi:hypothetical protein